MSRRNRPVRPSRRVPAPAPAPPAARGPGRRRRAAEAFDALVGGYRPLSFSKGHAFALALGGGLVALSALATPLKVAALAVVLVCFLPIFSPLLWVSRARHAWGVWRGAGTCPRQPGEPEPPVPLARLAEERDRVRTLLAMGLAATPAEARAKLAAGAVEVTGGNVVIHDADGPRAVERLAPARRGRRAVHPMRAREGG